MSANGQEGENPHFSTDLTLLFAGKAPGKGYKLVNAGPKPGRMTNRRTVRMWKAENKRVFTHLEETRLGA